MIADKGLDKAIKEVWGDLNAQLEEEREDSILALRSVIGRSNRSLIALNKELDSLSADNVKLRQRVYTLESKLSGLIDKLSENKKIKKLIE
ncbi:MAG: hypothetical protein WAX43_02955 [Lactococcus chungangensis]